MLSDIRTANIVSISCGTPKVHQKLTEASHLTILYPTHVVHSGTALFVDIHLDEPVYTETTPQPQQLEPPCETPEPAISPESNPKPTNKSKSF